MAGLTPIVANAEADFAVAQAVRAAAQQDADAIVLETVPDAQTFFALLEAAELGRLVVAAASATNVAQAVVTLLEMGLEPWPLAENLKAVVAYAAPAKTLPGLSPTRPAERGSPGQPGLDGAGRRPIFYRRLLPAMLRPGVPGHRRLL